MRDAAIDTHRSTARGAGRSRAAGAPPLDDMVGEGPVSRSAPRRGGVTSAAVAAQRLGGGRSPGGAARGRRGPGLAARLRGRLPRIKPLKALTVAAFGVALVGIVANAMVFQRGHHPSPLFGLGRSVEGASESAPRTAEAVPTPVPPVPAERTGTVPPAPAAPVEPAPPAVAAAPKPAPAHHAATKIPRQADPRPKAAEAASAASHPRPGHPAAAHAAVGPKAETRTGAKADPVAKLLAGAAHPGKPDVKAASAAKPDVKAASAAKPDVKAASAAKPASGADAKTAAVPAPHHRLAATADGAKPTVQPE